MLELTDIKVYHQQKCTLDIEHLTIQENQLTVILGHNGSGKSTLMKLLAREIVAKQGDVKLNNKNVNNYSHRDFAKQVAYLPQRLPQVAGLTVSELVRLGRFPWRGILGRWQAEDKHIIEQAMQQTDVLHYASHFADSLSGGERQRAWIAMLLAQQSPIFLLDEPTSALDLAHQYELMQLLTELNENGKGIVIILHDINLACRFAQRIIALKEGQICFDGPPKNLLNTQTLTALYGLPIELLNSPNQPHPIASIA